MQKSQDRTELLRSTPVKSALLKLGTPTLIGMSVSALYNVVDAFFVGQLGGSQMAAVSLFAPIATAMLGLALLFGGGAASYISRLLGAGKRSEANECASTSLATSMAVAILLLVGFVVFAEPFLRALGATDTMMPYAAFSALGFPQISNACPQYGNMHDGLSSLAIGWNMHREDRTFSKTAFNGYRCIVKCGRVLGYCQPETGPSAFF